MIHYRACLPSSSHLSLVVVTPTTFLMTVQAYFIVTDYDQKGIELALAIGASLSSRFSPPSLAFHLVTIVRYYHRRTEYVATYRKTSALVVQRLMTREEGIV